MNSRVKKIILLSITGVLLFGSGRLEKSINSDRDKLGLTISTPLQNAPPMLAFTTVALGGFRGLISNFLWIRSNDLQQDDKFFEAAQLADWITDLEPHFAQVWVYQAWNMAYNISVKFKENAPGDFSDRWHWVQRGIELLRDEGLKYNPHETLIYRELGWFFQHKMGQNLDDGNVYYKQEWAKAMTPFFGENGTNFENLIHPQTVEEKTNAVILLEKYKIDPVFAQSVDKEYGPLDWRLPETHAIYWAARGLDDAKKNPNKITPDDLIQLRRVIYQSMLQSLRHGRVLYDPFAKTYSLAPNLDLTDRLSETYQAMMRDDAKSREAIDRAYRNALRDAVYYLYVNNRKTEAAKWFKVLGDNYPDKILLDGETNSFPKNLTLDDFAVGRVQQELGDISQDNNTAIIEGLLRNSYYELALGSENRYDGFKSLAEKAYQRYVANTTTRGNDPNRVKLPSFAELNKTVLGDLLNTKNPVLPYAARAVIRTQLGMPAETISTNSVTTTNAIPTVSTNSISTNQPASAKP